MRNPASQDRRRALAVPLALACTAVGAQAPALLTVSGALLGPPAQGGRFEFDLPALQQLAQRKIVTGTPWYASVSEFSGPLLRDVLKAAGAAFESGGALRCTALNDYRVEIPLGDVPHFAHDGQAALRAVQQQDFDLVLMDLHMPGLDGIAATKAIRTLQGSKAELPIIALTADAFAETLTRCLEAGMNGFLTKPVTLDALAHALARSAAATAAAAPAMAASKAT
jgi:CheY-like chemotaxis protein